MRDILLTYDEDQGYIDIDIVDGQPLLVPEDMNPNDQRAAVATYMVKGTIPGMRDIGIEWSNYSQQNALLDIDNQIKRNIEQFVPTVNDTQEVYTPMYVSEDGQINAIVIRS